MTDFLLIRHGETDWNRELRFQGQIDVPLNDIGLLQAQRLEQRFARWVKTWQADQRQLTRVISSDLQRAQQTAEPVARVLGHECVVVPGLREQCFVTLKGCALQKSNRSSQPLGSVGSTLMPTTP
jgi:probable phosphoglycerate mutase